MDAEAELPVVHVGDVRRATDGYPLCVVLLPGKLALNSLAYITSTTQIEVLGDVPLGARAEPPGAPVIVAAGGCNSGRPPVLSVEPAASVKQRIALLSLLWLTAA